MKNPLVFLVVILLLVSYSCEEKIDIEKEKEAIMALVQGETDAFLARDYEKWCSFYAEDSTSAQTYADPYRYGVYKAWDVSSNKFLFTNKPIENKQVKTPIEIKIYEETAWIVFDTQSFYENGALGEDVIFTYFLEKHDGTWKIIYVNRISAAKYSISNNWITSSISYAKSLGKNVEEYAGYVGDQWKTGWNRDGGINALANNLIYILGPATPYGEFEVLERDDNHVVISANKLFSNLKVNPQLNVTYDDYLTYYRVIYERIADYLGVSYTQETTDDGILITVRKNTF
jgi:hypothetical protein